MQLHRPKPCHVRMVNGEVVEHDYVTMPQVPIVNWKSRGSGVVYEPARPMTTRSRRWKRLQLEHIARTLHGQVTTARESRLISR